MNLLAIFLTGLTTGGLACMAVQGGLLASVVANQKGRELAAQAPGRRTLDTADVLPVGMFLIAKLVAHTVLGFLLGWLGSALTLSLGAKLGFQILTALFLLATALNLLEVHPIFRFVVFQPPKFLLKLVRGSAQRKALFAPAVLGALTILVPCGVTQATEVLAINLGQPLAGGAIMFTFVLGTFPLFAFLGVATARLSEIWNSWFLKAAALALIVMAAISLNGVLVVLNAPLTLSKIGQAITTIGSPPQWYGQAGLGEDGLAPVVDGYQQVQINITDHGYQPRYVKVQKGIPVKLELVTQDTFSCATSFVLREFNIQRQLQPNDRQTVTFTPSTSGKFPYTCAMGMYSGTLEVR